MAQVAHNSGCSNTLGRVEYSAPHEIIYCDTFNIVRYNFQSPESNYSTSLGQDVKIQN